jgi:hypothetical protein
VIGIGNNAQQEPSAGNDQFDQLDNVAGLTRSSSVLHDRGQKHGDDRRANAPQD